MTNTLILLKMNTLIYFQKFSITLKNIYVEQGVRFKSVGGETSPKTLKILSNY